MDPNEIIEDLIVSSGYDDDDDDDYNNLDEEDSDLFEESSGSGDLDDETEEDFESTMDTPTVTFGNDLVEGDFHKPKKNEIGQKNKDLVVVKNAMPDEHESNEILMASTSNGFFSRTEVVIAVVAGGLVGLVFAVIIVLLVMRVRNNKKGDVSYDTVKKPIYKKAPTIEA
ncbi:syndecan-4-like isoform X2 [Rhinoderma darwinii]